MNNPNRIKKLLICLALLTIALFLMNGKMLAQTTLVTVEGKVVDEEGTLLPGANVTVRNVQTGFTKGTTTQTDGWYLISGILPGQYEIEVSLPGFTTKIRKGLTFSVGSRLTIDFTLTTATLEEEVTVTAESPMVEVTKSEVSAVIERKKIDSLPLYDRDFSDLTLIKAGVAGDRSNAQPGGSEEIMIDGVSNEWVGRNTTNLEIPADAIQEFRVMTNQYEAEYGNASGMIRSAITRSGTNEMRGRAAFFYRDEIFDDVNYFVKHDEYEGPEVDYEKEEFKHYNYSGFLGGPLKQDKAHFFINYDGVYHEEYFTITSPLVTKETLPRTRKRHQLLSKFNYQFNEKNLMSFRYSLNRPTYDDYGAGGMYTYSTSYDIKEITHDFQLNWTYYPTDNTMNEVRLLYSYNTYAYECVDNDSYFIQRPSGYFGALGNLPQEVPTSRYQFVDNFSLFMGPHSIKFGVDASYVYCDGYVAQYVPGYYVFVTDDPFDAADPATYPLLLIKAPEIADVDQPYWEVGIFAQDSWRVSPRLTLNFGLRYNYYDVQFIDIKKFDFRHFNPRFGFSFDPIGDGKTSIRGGIGTYSQNPQLNLGLLIGVMDQLVIQYIYYPGYPDPSVPNPFIGQGPVSEPPLTKYQGEPDTICPYTVQTTLGFQREFLTDFSVGVDLVYSKGMKFSRIENDNPVIPGTAYLRADMTKADIFVFRMNGRSDYKGLYLTLSKRYSHGWSLDIAYTLSRSWSDVETEQTGPYDNDVGNWDRMYGPNDYDATHRLVITGIVDLPLGFQLSGLAHYHSALPWTAFYSTDVNLDGLNWDMLGEHRNDRRGFDFFNLNIRLSKFITIKQFRFQLFAEGYNITNQSNFSSIFFRYDTPGFGKPTTAGDARRIQFGVRIDF
jgi:outer membrane receptor protein involved in Fe transport